MTTLALYLLTLLGGYEYGQPGKPGQVLKFHIGNIFIFDDIEYSINNVA